MLNIRLLLSIAILMLSSCSYYYQHQEQVVRGKACYRHCEQQNDQCTQICDDNQNVCRAKNDAMTAARFVRYQHQQAVKGQIMIAELPAFRDPLACRKTTCDCEQDKRMCKQACRGTIYKRLQSVM